MGSRFMHLLVADYVATELDIRDRRRMLLGSLAPDAAQSKSISHFQGELHRYALNAPLDFGKYVVKYLDRLADPFFIDYLTHLVVDDVWTMKTDFNGFESRVKEKPELYLMYHGDLWLCNAKLIEMYKAERLHDELQSAHGIPDMDEVGQNDVIAYKLLALEDFNYPPENVIEPLKLFTLDDMVHYVERCKSNALDVCRIVLAISEL